MKKPEYYAVKIEIPSVHLPHGNIQFAPKLKLKGTIKDYNGFVLSKNFLPLKYEIEGTLYDKKGYSDKLVTNYGRIVKMTKRLNEGKNPETSTAADAVVIAIGIGLLVLTLKLFGH